MKRNKILTLTIGVVLFFTIVGLPTIFEIIQPSKAFAACNDSWCGYDGSIPPCGCVNCEPGCGPTADTGNGDLCSGCDQYFLTETATYQLTLTPDSTSTPVPSPTATPTPQYVDTSRPSDQIYTLIYNSLAVPTSVEDIYANTLAVSWYGWETRRTWENSPTGQQYAFMNPEIVIGEEQFATVFFDGATGAEIVQDGSFNPVSNRALSVLDLNNSIFAPNTFYLGIDDTENTQFYRVGYHCAEQLNELELSDPNDPNPGEEGWLPVPGIPSLAQIW